MKETEFHTGDRVVIGPRCHDTQFCGITGIVLEAIQPNGDRQGNRVSLDRPVNHACVLWFTDEELYKL